jgi:hypothetical protein
MLDRGKNEIFKSYSNRLFYRLYLSFNELFVVLKLIYYVQLIVEVICHIMWCILCLNIRVCIHHNLTIYFSKWPWESISLFSQIRKFCNSIRIYRLINKWFLLKSITCLTLMVWCFDCLSICVENKIINHF